MALSQVVISSDFSFAKFGQARIKKIFNVQRNDFYHADFSGFDFSEAFAQYNRFVLTDLTDCNLKGVRFDTGRLNMANLKNASLAGARIRWDQQEYLELSPKQQREMVLVNFNEELDDDYY